MEQRCWIYLRGEKGELKVRGRRRKENKKGDRDREQNDEREIKKE